MTVTKTPSDQGVPVWVHLAGTIQEVLNKLSVLGIRGKQVIFYSDDGTNAEVMFCRKR